LGIWGWSRVSKMRWTDQEEDILIVMYDMGDKPAAIAARLDTDIWRVYNKIRAFRALNILDLPGTIKWTRRHCMTCGERFRSQGIQNRMCDDCRLIERNETRLDEDVIREFNVFGN